MSKNATPDEASFLSGGGEMGALIRAKDWSQTSIGEVRNWSTSLRTTLGMLLQSKFPMFLFWGPELLCFYNDAYRPSLGDLGKHPDLLGKPAKAGWEEAWPTISPLIDQVWRGEEAIWQEDQLVPIYRNGQIEEVYWTFSYSAVKDETDRINGVLAVCQETTQQVNLMKIVQQQVFLGNLFSVAPVAITIFREPNFIIEMANERMLEYWGRPLDEVIHKPFFEALPESKGQGYEAILTQVYTTRQRFVADEMPLDLLRNGKIQKTFVNFIYEPYYEPNSSIIRIIVVANEVTEQVVARKKLEEFAQELEQKVHDRTRELTQANEDLEKKNQELASFAYVSSHDLQEPLRKIQTFAAHIITKERDNLSDTGKDYFQRMQNAAKRMQQLIGDLLTYSRTNTSEKIFVQTDLNALVQEVKYELERLIEEQKATIQTTPLPVLSVIPYQFRQLFTNLLSNALKFAKPNVAPVITIAAETISGQAIGHPAIRTDKTYYHLSFSDNGIGFEPEHENRIFEVFQRLHGRAEYEGTGIGLAICKKIVENHQGVLTATGKPEEGAIFHIYLPE